MLHVLFFCLGFCVAVLYLDLVFDVSAVPYRNTNTALPANILTPITTYYRYVTRNPWLLIFVMSVAITCIVAELLFGQAPRWVGYSSLAVFGLIALLAVARVIPWAQRLASGEESVEGQTRLAHGLFPFHMLFLILILSLVLLQSSTAGP
ncbi:MAG: hypothetical protein ACE5EG_01340 [Thermoanaerobaculia bacterium]